MVVAEHAMYLPETCPNTWTCSFVLKYQQMKDDNICQLHRSHLSIKQGLIWPLIWLTIYNLIGALSVGVLSSIWSLLSTVLARSSVPETLRSLMDWLYSHVFINILFLFFFDMLGFSSSGWRRDVGTVVAVLTLCEGNPPIIGGFHPERVGNGKFCYFFLCYSEQTVDWLVGLSVFWDALATMVLM